MNDAKPTMYNGVLYRSKNEAKWARFFDVIHIPCYYEYTTVTGWNGVRYKPDFYFPAQELYAEVKTNKAGIHNDKMIAKLCGAIDYEATNVANGLILLGAFPFDVRVPSVYLCTSWLFWYEGVCSDDVTISADDSGIGEFKVSMDHPCYGAPFPEDASPDIRIVPDRGNHTAITRAINETNDYFNKKANEFIYLPVDTDDDLLDEWF